MNGEPIREYAARVGADENNISQKLKRAEKELAEAYNPGEVWCIFGADNSSLVTHPLKSRKTVVALLRQGQKVVLLLHTPFLQAMELLSKGAEKGFQRYACFRQSPRNPLISSLLM